MEREQPTPALGGGRIYKDHMAKVLRVRREAQYQAELARVHDANEEHISGRMAKYVGESEANRPEYERPVMKHPALAAPYTKPPWWRRMLSHFFNAA